MTLLWCDGFEGQDHTSIYTSVTNTWTSTATTTRLGYGRYIQSAGNSRSLQLSFTPSADIYMGMGYRTLASGDGFIDFYGDTNATLHIRIAITANGAIEIRRSASTVVATSADGLWVTNQWMYIEVHVKVSDTVGAVEVRLNGGTTPVVSFSGDTKNAGTSTNLDSIRWVTPNSGTPIYSIDDIYICNGLGSLRNGFLGDCRVQTQVPNGAGSSTGLTPSTGSNWQTVDELPASSTDYSGSATVGARDTYAMEDLVAGTAAVLGTRDIVYWHKSDAGAASMKRAMKVGSTVNYGSTTALPTTMGFSQVVRETSPDTSAAWTVSEINAIELGAEVA